MSIQPVSRLLSVLSVAGLGLLAACGGGGGGGVVEPEPAGGDTATMELVLTDHPLGGDVESVMVTIDSMTAHHRNGAVFEFLDRPMSLDLLALRGRHRSLGVREVEAGVYDNFQLHMSEGHLVIAGRRYPMDFRSREGRMPGPVDVPMAGAAVVVMDFDAESSIEVEHGTEDRFHMDPVLRDGGSDVRGSADCPGHDDHAPAHEAVGVPVDTDIIVQFPMGGMGGNGGMRPADPDGLVEVHRDSPEGPMVQGAVSVRDGTVVFSPHAPLEPGTTYHVAVHEEMMPGFHFCGEDGFSFTTRN